jgi:hypothetical protein
VRLINSLVKPSRQESERPCTRKRRKNNNGWPGPDTATTGPPRAIRRKIASTSSAGTTCIYIYVVPAEGAAEVKQSHYRPGQALRIPGSWGSQISRQSAHDGGKVVSPTHQPPLPPRKYSWYPFLLRGWVDPWAIVRPEGLCQWKTPKLYPVTSHNKFVWYRVTTYVFKYYYCSKCNLSEPWNLPMRDFPQLFVDKVGYTDWNVSCHIMPNQYPTKVHASAIQLCFEHWSDNEVTHI